MSLVYKTCFGSDACSHSNILHWLPVLCQVQVLIATTDSLYIWERRSWSYSQISLECHWPGLLPLPPVGASHQLLGCPLSLDFCISRLRFYVYWSIWLKRTYPMCSSVQHLTLIISVQNDPNNVCTYEYINKEEKNHFTESLSLKFTCKLVFFCLAGHTNTLHQLFYFPLKISIC
jgi:hypothetical protein